MRLQQQEQEYGQMSTNGEFKQEVVLYGLKDWVLDSWERAHAMTWADEQESLEAGESWQLVTSLIQHGIGDLFHVRESFAN